MLVFKYLKSKNGYKGNRKKKKVRDLFIALLEDKETQEELVNMLNTYTILVIYIIRCIQKELY